MTLADGGSVPGLVTTECRKRYLEPQLKALPNAVVVALGWKAAKRLRGVARVFTAFAAAPPGCSLPARRTRGARLLR